jgi:large subunit ribosomal protein L6
MAPRATALFSTTSKRPSKLGRTPLSIPPGVELTVGEPFAHKDLTTYKRVFKKTISVKGPLGAFYLRDWRLRVLTGRRRAEPRSS